MQRESDGGGPCTTMLSSAPPAAGRAATSLRSMPQRPPCHPLPGSFVRVQASVGLLDGGALSQRPGVDLFSFMF